jgi:prepilin-type N-terminal cleavage/methylation domain-containing protein
MKSTTRKGFTLIELLIVVVIIGILAAIAIPKFASTKEKAYIAAMKTDLRNLVTAQEGYFADNQTYSTTLAALNNFSGSANVTITDPSSATATGWAASATHAQVASITGCTVEVGDQVSAGNKDGVPVCQ